jgi:hypothetical protein
VEPELVAEAEVEVAVEAEVAAELEVVAEEGLVVVVELEEAAAAAAGVELEEEVEVEEEELETGEAMDLEAAIVGAASMEVAAQRPPHLHCRHPPKAPLRLLREVHHPWPIMVLAASSILMEGRL